jgi:hypothetical protein
MACISYNDAAFRALFPSYANPTTYPQSTVQGLWNQAILYVSNQYGGGYCVMSLAQQTQAINLMTAHLLFLQGMITAGTMPTLTTGASIDKVSVTLTPPPLPNQWQWWLGLSPYGQQLLALFQVVTVGGFFASSAPPGRAGFKFSGVR